MLGARWHRNNTTSTTSYAYIYPMNSTTGSISSAHCTGPQMKNVWAISLTQTKSGQLPQVTVVNGKATLMICANPSPDYIWFRIRPLGSEVAVDLFLEPI
ncbi:hypothetical protein M407DRAFT_243344 [Tulasnella calospora MUT 4182]|uniref:Uncharacterized protein n=1 Tax=Tulasnella calospora MUT 4182 TaxID=1051891 RepID=A0A0C3L121_9AGAM|nr:hypothetical protein M407DRAFT_243344 [Tulasnella calospora MUT 4182]